MWRFQQGSAATHIPLTEDRSSPLVGEVVLFDRAHSIGRDAHGSVTEEGETRLASQISRINPGDGWGDICRSQIALMSRTAVLLTRVGLATQVFFKFFVF